MRNGYKNRWMTSILMAGMVSAACVFPALASEDALCAPESAGWSRLIETTAVWDKVENAKGYQVRLYFDDEYIQSVNVKGTKADLSEYMTREGWYYYEVRAVAGNKTGVNYRRNSEYTESEGQLIDDLGDTEGRWRSYIDGKKYQKEDGTYAGNGWCRIRGEWYYFDENSYMVTGWEQVNSVWYYMDEDGIMQTGWLKEEGNTYYLNKDGAMTIGWEQINPGQWYYFQADGSMAVNTVVDGYKINESGVWVQ